MKRWPSLLLLSGLLVLESLSVAKAQISTFSSPNCATDPRFPVPVIGQTFCFDQTANVLKGWNGTRWVSDASISINIANVMDYGAKGDGVTNDRAAIVAAFGAATTGTIVWFPPTAAYYSVINNNSSGATMSPQPGTHIVGYGAKIQLDGSTASNAGEVLRVNGNDGITIEGLEITINPALIGTKEFNGIGIARRIADNALFNRTRIVNNYIHGFKSFSAGDGTGITAEVGGTGLLIQGNIIENCDNGIWLGTSTLYPLRDVSVVGNSIKTVANSLGNLGLTGNAIMVNHNTSVDAIRPDTDDLNATIAGNVIDGAPVAIHIQGVGRVNVLGNVARNITSYGVFIEESQYLNISNNVIGGTLTNYVKILQISGAFGNRHQRIQSNNFLGSTSGAGVSADGSLSRSWIVLNQMQAVAGARFSIGSPLSNVIIDADETSSTGLTEFINGLLLDNATSLNWKNTRGTVVRIMRLDASNNVVFQRGGGVDAWQINNAGALQGLGSSPLQLATTTFANLGANLIVNGQMLYCTDCDPGAALTCTSAGAKTGAWAVRVNGKFKCVG